MAPHSLPLLRSRPDLEVVAHKDARGRRFSVKDPISLEYFQFGQREAFLLEQLRSPKTVAELQRAYEQRFAPDQITQDQVLRFCASMHDCSLLIPEGSGQGPVRAGRTRRGIPRALGALSSPLAIRFPGVDPTPLLKRLDWLGRLAFSELGLALALLAAAVVGIFLLGRFEGLLAELYLLTDLLQPEYAGAALLAVAVLKTWHELGHGLACRRFGGECHEMGVMLLFFLPCLYCDVSDTWMFRDRWRRAVVALGGVYFEFLLAIVTALAWMCLAPGFPKVLCLYFMVVASVSTLLVNLNPFLRFDGYYLLSDLWAVPNLYEQSRRALWQPLQQWISGIGPSEQRFDASRGLLAAYALAAIAQFAVIIVGGLWAFYRLFARNDLRPLGDVLVGVVVLGLLVRFCLSLKRTMQSHPVRGRLGSFVRLLMIGGAAAGILWLMGGLSIEQSLWSPCRLESSAAAHITAPLPGELVQGASYGQPIEAGDAVAILRDPQLELRLLKLQGEEADVATRLVGLRAMAQRDARLFSEIAVLETRQLELQQQQATLRKQAEKLILRSPLMGVVMRGPPRSKLEGEDLGRWTGGVFDPENVHCGLEAGDFVCIVGGHAPLQAVIMLDESDSGLANPGDEVRIALDRAPAEYLTGRVEEIALATSEDRRARPINSADLAVEDSLRRSLDRSGTYRVLVRLDRPTALGQHGAVGQARIVTGEETVRQWITRWLRRMFVGGLISQ